MSQIMHRSSQPIRTGSGTDLAFAVMVLAAYFTTFSTIKSISVSVLVAIIVLGVAYITIGVYGYAYIAQHSTFSLKIGYFVTQIILGVLIVYLGGGVGFNAMVLLPLAGHSVVLLPEFWRYTVNGVIICVYAVTIRLMTGGWDAMWANLPVFIAGQVFILVFTQMAVSEEHARHEIQDLVEELGAANRRLREYALQAGDLAISNERNRMAREIHDGLGHHLTALNMQIKAARAVLGSNVQKAGELLSNAEGLTQQALVDVRQSVSALRETGDDMRSLPEQIQSALNPCIENGIMVRFHLIGEPRNVSAQISLTLYRSTQECVNNALKHSAARQILVELDYTSQKEIGFSFYDDGVGCQNADGGFGLIGMKERVQLLEGEMIISTALGKGFQIGIHLPG
jgi:signal transduction histidine kinase